jgi:serine/threonine-protein kinase
MSTPATKDSSQRPDIQEAVYRMIDRARDCLEEGWQRAGGIIAQIPHPFRRNATVELLNLAEAFRQDPVSAGIPPDSLPVSSSNREAEFFPQIPGFTILKLLGRGGMGEVYLAAQENTASPLNSTLDRIAIKLIRPDLLTDLTVRRVMENDILIASLLRHENIVSILQVSPANGPLFFTMPYLHGGNLADRISGVPIPSREAATLLLPVARAVVYLHDRPRPILHLDLKPANVLLDATGNPKLADFGLSHLLESDGRTLVTHGIAGTFEYMSPEQCRGKVNKSSDIYGLGAILYEMLTGKPPFRGSSPLETLDQVQQQEVIPPRELNQTVDRRLEAICLKCLEKESKHRYDSATEVVEELETYLRGGNPVAANEGWWAWLHRHLDRAVFFQPARQWSQLLTGLAMMALILHAFLGMAIRNETDSSVFWLWFLAGDVLGEWIPWLLMARKRRFDQREREILLFWIGVSIGRLVLFAQNCPLGSEVSADQVFRFYSSSLVLYGVMLFVEGRLYWGKLYLLGTADFVLAALLLSVPRWSPLIFGLWHAGALLLISRHLRRIAREHEAYDFTRSFDPDR